MPWNKIAIISLGMLAVGALKRPIQDKWKSFREWGYIPRSEIFGDSYGKFEQIKEAIEADKAKGSAVADISPVNTDIQSKPSVVDAPIVALPANMQIRPIQHEENLTREERNFLAERLRAVRLMEDIKRERYKLTRQMAKAKENNDTEQIKKIESYRAALKVLRKEAFETAAGPLLGQIKEERRLLTKKMTLARRRKDATIMAEITKRRAFLKIQEEVLKSTVREFKYKQERATFLKPTLIQKMTPLGQKRKATPHTRV